MLTVMPEDSKEILLKNKCEKDGQVLVARDGLKKLGHIVVNPKKDTLVIEEIKIENTNDLIVLNFDDKYLVELLLRAAGNYAMNRGILVMESTDMNVFFAAEQLGFKQDSEKTIIKLNELFKPCRKAEDS